MVVILGRGDVGLARRVGAAVRRGAPRADREAAISKIATVARFWP